jgi:hypothetical protein
MFCSSCSHYTIKITQFCWLWSLIIFLIQIVFNCLYPMKTVHPSTWGAGGQGAGGWSFPRRKNCLVNVYCNFIVNLDRSLQGRKFDGRSYVRVFFSYKETPFMRELYCSCVSLRILYSERGYCERNKRKLHRVCCRLYPFICCIIIKEGSGNLSSGRSPHWVNHVYLCLYFIVYILCFIFTFVLFYCSTIMFF